MGIVVKVDPLSPMTPGIVGGKDRKCQYKAGEKRMEAHRRPWKEEVGINFRRC